MVEETIAAIKKAHVEAKRVVFIAHPMFKDGVATVTTAGPLTLVTARPEWWALLLLKATDGMVVPADPTKTFAGMKFQGIAVLPLKAYTSDPDWPVIMEAIIRLKLIDISAVFG